MIAREAARAVQKRFVERRQLDQRRERLVDLVDLRRNFGVFVDPRLVKHRLRTEPLGLCRRHRAVYAELAGGLVGRARHAASLHRIADDHWASGERRIIPPRDRGEGRNTGDRATIASGWSGATS